MVTDLETVHRRPYMTTQNSLSIFSAWRRTSGLARGLAIAALAAGGWALSAGATAAHARDVYWSVGVESPGVSVGVSNAPPPRVVVHHPRPVYVEPAPVVVYSDRYRPRPVYVERAPVVIVQDRGYRHDRHSRWEERRRARHERWDRHHRYDRYDHHDHHGKRDKHRGHRD
jgi:hypothetical protein